MGLVTSRRVTNSFRGGTVAYVPPEVQACFQRVDLGHWAVRPHDSSAWMHERDPSILHRKRGLHRRHLGLQVRDHAHEIVVRRTPTAGSFPRTDQRTHHPQVTNLVSVHDAGLTLPFHNGRTEGANTRTKRIMRQMHG